MLRRDILKYLITSLVLSITYLSKPLTAFAKEKVNTFTETDFGTALKNYFPNQKIIESNKIKIDSYPVVENGAFVPLKINTTLPNVESITIFVDKNPNFLTANFNLSPVCKGFIATRIKIQYPSNVYVAVKSDGKIYINHFFVEVHEGGCG